MAELLATVPTARVLGWRAALMAYLEAAAKEPFAWGQMDCAQFAGRAVEAVMGANPVADLRGTYDTPDGAWATVRRAGHHHLVDMVEARLGAPQRAQKARRGDVVLWRPDRTDAPLVGSVAPFGGILGICLGDGAVFKLMTGGLMIRPMDRIAPTTVCWRI